MNLEFVLYDHHTPHIIEMRDKMVTTKEEKPHVPHQPPFEDDGAHCDDDKEDVDE